MVNLQIKNIKEIEEPLRDRVISIIKEKKEFYDKLFKKYDKDLTLEVIFDKSSAVYKVTAALDMKSKKLLSVEENKDVIKAINKLMSKFKTAVKKQHELERKDYEFKRKR